MAVLDPQAALDATALIAGGVIKRAGVYQGAGGIAGVKLAYSSLPDQGDLIEPGVTHVSFWDAIPTIRGGAGDFTAYDHLIRIQVMIAVGLSNLPTAHRILLPFLKLYRNAFAANVSLKGTCDSSQFVRSTGIVPAIYPDRIALEMFWSVTQKEAVTYIL